MMKTYNWQPHSDEALEQAKRQAQRDVKFAEGQLQQRRDYLNALQAELDRRALEREKPKEVKLKLTHIGKLNPDLRSDVEVDPYEDS